MIQIKFHFGDWHIATEEEAKAFVKNMLARSAIPNDKQIKQIEKSHLKGTTVKVLLADEKGR